VSYLREIRRVGGQDTRSELEWEGGCAVDGVDSRQSSLTWPNMTTPQTAPETIKSIQDLYLKKVPIKDIERALNVSRPTVYRYVNEMGGHSRYVARPDHTVWHEAFDHLTDEAAYWVGLLLTDGSIGGEGRRVKLCLQGRDAPTVEKLRAFVRTSAPVGKLEVGSRGLRFTSVHMCARLAELGVVPRKTCTARAPDCLLDNRHFWRGVIDGDGTLVLGGGSYSPSVRLTGFSDAPLLGQWATVCSSMCSLPFAPRVRPGSPRVSDMIVNGAAAVKMLRWMYDGCTPASPVIERKLATYQEILRLHEHRPITPKGAYAKGSRITDPAVAEPQSGPDLTQYRTPNGVVIGEGDWCELRKSTSNANLAASLCSAMEGMPMPDAMIGEKRARTAFEELRSTPLGGLLEPGRITLLRSPETVQPDYHTRLRPPGNNASNYLFHKLRLRTPKAGSPSAWDKWHDPELRLRVCQRFLTLSHVRKVDNATIRRALHKTGATPVQFKPGVAKAVYELTQSSRVLDLSMGWGDRLAGFLASSCTQHYTGIDPNPDLHPLYRQQVDMYGAGKDVTLIHAAAEDVILPAQSFDIAFTSPPYFGQEKYGAGTGHESSQSWSRYPTPDQWRDKFLRPVLERAWSALRHGGVLAINIADVSQQGAHYPLCDWTRTIVDALPGSTFQFALGMRLQSGNYSGDQRSGVAGEPIWIWSKGPRDLPRALPGRTPGAEIPHNRSVPPVPVPTLPRRKPSVRTGHRGSPKTDPAREAIALAAYDSGLGSTTAARKAGVSCPTLYSILRRNGRTPRALTPRRSAEYYLAHKQETLGG
jgi:hypothetical protein